MIERLAIVAMLAAGLAGGAETAPAKDRIRQMEETARSLPAEFAADILLRLAGEEGGKERERKAELYEAAFQMAAGAVEPGPKKAAFGALPESDLRYQGLAAGLRLDRLSIQLRAVEGMLRVKPAKARELFEQIPAPAVAKLTCADGMVSDPGLYYETLRKVVEKTYTAEEQAKQEQIRALLGAVQRTTSTVELAALARVLPAMKLTGEQQELLLTAFAGRLTAVEDDDRTYSYALTALQFPQRMEALVGQAGGAAEALREGWKSLVTRQEKGVRCQGVMQEETFKTPGANMVIGSAVNSDTKVPDKPELAVHVRAFPQTDDTRALAGQIRGLWITPEGQMYRPDQKGTEWQAKAMDVLAAIDAWQPPMGDRATEGFHEKLALYRGVLQAGAGAELQQKVLESYVAALCGSGAQTERPAEWLVELNVLLDMIRMPKGVPAQGALREGMLRELGQGRNAVAAAYAAMEAEYPAGTAGWRELEAVTPTGR